MIRSLFKKDFSNAPYATGSAILLGIPLLLVLQWTSSDDPQRRIPAISAFWILYLFSSASLFFRSFSLEHKNQNFGFYVTYNIPRLAIFISQYLVNVLSLAFISAFFVFIIGILWSEWIWNLYFLSIVVSLTLAPLGTLLSLFLSFERELLFPLLYLPFVTPVSLAAFSLSHEFSSSWWGILIIFFLASGFLSAFFFRFFFNDLTQRS